MDFVDIINEKMHDIEYGWIDKDGNRHKRIKKIKTNTYFIVHYDGDKCPTHTFILYKYSAPNKNLSCPEFYAHCEKGVVIEL